MIRKQLSKLHRRLVFFSILWIWLFTAPNSAYAQRFSTDGTCFAEYGISASINTDRVEIGKSGEFIVYIKKDTLNLSSEYEVILQGQTTERQAVPTNAQINSNGEIEIVFTNDQATGVRGIGGRFLQAYLVEEVSLGRNRRCVISSYQSIGSNDNSSCNIAISNTDGKNRFCGGAQSTFNVEVTNATFLGEPANGSFPLFGKGGFRLGTISLTNGSGRAIIPQTGNDFKPGTKYNSPISVFFNQRVSCKSEDELVILSNADSCDEYIASTSIPAIFQLCSEAALGNNGINPCQRCYDNQGIWTAVGCLPTQPKDLIPRLVQFSIGIAGGVALMLMLIGAFRLSVSAGNPEALKVAKEMITNAIAGLIVIIFSAVLLQVIGVEILKIPGF